MINPEEKRYGADPLIYSVAALGFWLSFPRLLNDFANAVSGAFEPAPALDGPALDMGGLDFDFAF